MQILNYNHNALTLEIFPAEIYSDPLIVYHATISSHSYSIENNGFIVNIPPYPIVNAQSLINFLQSPQISKYDLPKGFWKWTIAQGIEHYLDSIQKDEFSISFASLSSACVSYAFSETKGGQAFRDIREAKQLIDDLMNKNIIQQNIVPQEVIDLFSQLESLEQSTGVVYAVRLPGNLDGIECSAFNVVHSRKSLPVASIVAKIILPPNPTELSISPDLLKDKNKEKLHTNNGIAVQLWRNQMESE
ncbi:MAG TPA: hypothetical protein VGF30_08935 [Bacteroidia bacterium]